MHQPPIMYANMIASRHSDSSPSLFFSLFFITGSDFFASINELVGKRHNISPTNSQYQGQVKKQVFDWLETSNFFFTSNGCSVINDHRL